MKPIHYDEFAKALCECYAAMQRDEPPEAKIRAAFKALASYELDEVKQACAQAAKMDLQYVPGSGKLISIIKRNRESSGPALEGHIKRCSFVNGGVQCPLRGWYPSDPKEPGSDRECEHHHFASNDRHKAEILDDIIRSRPAGIPHWQDAKLAQDLLQSQDEADVVRQLGPRAVAFVKRHQIRFPNILDFYRNQKPSGAGPKGQNPQHHHTPGTSVSDAIDVAFPGVAA